MAFVNTVDIVGDEALTTSIIDRSITEIADNTLKVIGGGAFYGCRNMTKVDFPAAIRLENNALQGCSNLTALVLRGETVCVLSTSFILTSTPISRGTGYIYVPAALVDTYKAATNWSAYAAQFRALEDYTVDGTTTGELDSSKI